MVVEVDWRVEKTQENSDCVLLSENVTTHTSVLVGGKVIVHGGYSTGYGSLSILYIFDPSTKAWQNIPVTTDPRQFHAILLVDDKIYLHGGGSDHMEQWDIVTHEMEKAIENYAGLSETSTRCWGHTLEFYEAKSMFLMFGGIANIYGLLSYHVNSGTWKKLNATGVSPENRVRHASCIVCNRMYIYGGATPGANSRALDNLSVLTMEPHLSWSTLVEQRGIGRVGASLSHVAGRLVVYGGNSALTLNLPKSEFLLVFNSLNEQPCIQREEAVLNDGIEARLRHTAIVQGDEILIIGGKKIPSIGATMIPPMSFISWLSLSW